MFAKNSHRGCKNSSRDAVNKTKNRLQGADGSLLLAVGILQVIFPGYSTG